MRPLTPKQRELIEIYDGRNVEVAQLNEGMSPQGFFQEN